MSGRLNFGEIWRQASELPPLTPAQRAAGDAMNAVGHAGVMVDLDDAGHAVLAGTLTTADDPRAPVASVSDERVADAVAFVEREAAPFRAELRAQRASRRQSHSVPVPTTATRVATAPRARERRDSGARQTVASGDDSDSGEAPPARAERVAFFGLLADGEHPLELRCTNGTHWFKCWADSPADADRIAREQIDRGREAYVGLAPRMGRDGEAQVAYAPCLVLWADCDSDRAVRALELFEPAPTLVALSGGFDGATPKRHAYWRLTAPLNAEGGGGAEVRRHVLRLAQYLGADVRACDAPRVMRVPGSRHPSTGHTATVERFTGETHELAAITGDLPDAPQWEPPRSKRPAKTDDELARLFLGHYQDGDGRHEHFRSVVGVLLARCGRLPPDVLLELAVCWAQAHTHPCKPRAELERNFDNVLARELTKRGLAA